MPPYSHDSNQGYFNQPQTLPPVSSFSQEPPSTIPPRTQPAPTEDRNKVLKPLNVKDALSYLDQVKFKFSGQPEVYNRFLDIMKDFKSQDHYAPAASNEPSADHSTVPSANFSHPDAQHRIASAGLNSMMSNNNSNVLPRINPLNNHEQSTRVESTSARQKGPIEFNHAINYVNKVKTRFSSTPETYRYFLEILQTYQKDDKAIQDVYAQVQVLFASAPDLLEEFKQFLPDNSPLSVPSSNGPIPSQPVKKPAKRPNVAQPPSQYYPQPTISQTQQMKKKVKVGNGKTEKLSTAEEMEFFEKCKRVIGNKTTYNEFLKILNLFSQEIIEAKVLIDRVEPFLGKSPELFEWFKRFVKYEDDDVSRPVCSGREELAKEVLNDDWVSLPNSLTESGGFIAHRKTPHEEAMYKCEEERYEFDLNIEANLSVIALLDPIAKKIQLMPAEERSRFKLPLGLGGNSTTIYTRILKKIYDVERGLEVIDALHQNPAVAVPIVLKRLKQKDEEWKRSQREWNKVWREIEAKNFSKALDHQGINFKTTDRKAILTKSLVTEIEIMYLEQKEKKSTLANRYQFDFGFKNREMFEYVHKILLNYVENTSTISTVEEEKIRSLLNEFVPQVFMIEIPAAVNGTEEDGEAPAVVAKNIPESTNEIVNSPMDIEKTVEEGKPMEVDGMNDNPDSIPRKRESYTLYANNNLYCLFRLYQMLYSRLCKMKEVSDSLYGVKPRSEEKNQVAVELGFRKENTVSLTEKDRFSELMKDINLFVNSEMESNDFEDKVRDLFWTSGYIIFTVDKLVQAIVKQLQTVAMDSKSLELITLYGRDREKSNNPVRQEALYRLGAETIIQDDSIYRLEYVVGESLMSMQLLGKEDQVSDDNISSEERWSLYVDQFVQLSSTESANSKRRDPFCKRNLPTHVGDDPPLNVETRSGLELKICVNTYKIFFVDNTEDYFRRKRSTNHSSLLGLTLNERLKTNSQIRQQRHNKFRKWLDSDKGWKATLTPEDAAKQSDEFDKWIVGDNSQLTSHVSEYESYRIVTESEQANVKAADVPMTH
ncbi:Transcriptional regulatory protein sin3 [Globomyces sp. JEL0801]|nr:Transcriptional regulatory protein sin3 [Globomyces sp. JEL0801]